MPQAMAAVVNEAGKRYDPRIVELLSQHYEELEKDARNVPSDLPLSRNVKVERGLKPAAGFEAFSQVSDGAEFVHSIGEARQEAQVLFDVTQILVNSLSLPQMLEPLADCVRRLIPFDTF